MMLQQKEEEEKQDAPLYSAHGEQTTRDMNRTRHSRGTSVTGQRKSRTKKEESNAFAPQKLIFLEDWDAAGGQGGGEGHKCYILQAGEKIE
jgi:hypothetical protein